MAVGVTRSRGKWRAYCRDARGVRHYKRLPLSADQPEATARRLALEWERELLLADRRPEGPQPLALASVLGDLLDAKVRNGAAAATQQMLRHHGRRLVEHFGAARDVHELDLRAAEAYVDARRKGTGPEGEGAVSMHTVQKELGALRQALRLAQRHGDYHGDPSTIWPADALRGSYKPRDRWLPPEEYRLVLAAMRPKWRPHLVVSVWTGVRIRELLCILPEDVDAQAMELRVRGTKTAGSERMVPLTIEALEALRGVTLPLAEPDEDTPADPFARPRRAWQKALERACVRAKVAKATPNDLRRTFASWCANAGVGELECARLLGHSSSAMVRKVYAQLASATLRGAVDRMAESVRPKAAARGGRDGRG